MTPTERSSTERSSPPAQQTPGTVRRFRRRHGHGDGWYVAAKDYDALQAENERLRAVSEALANALEPMTRGTFWLTTDHVFAANRALEKWAALTASPPAANAASPRLDGEGR